MQAEWRNDHRLFVAEYDFTEYFESIAHQHIWETIESLGLIMTALEKSLIGAFLSAPLPYTSKAERAEGRQVRRKGVPLGTSISLLLANVAASPLDRALERLGVGFVRYADDTIIWSRDYAAICRAVDELHQASTQIGSPINQVKSMGVRLLVSRETANAELPATSEVTYLSHNVGLTSMRMKQANEQEIKRRVAALLYNNLLREPLQGTQGLSRLGLNDKDYIVYIWQLRRYLYGRLSENAVRRMGHGAVPRIQLRGVLARFPLIDDDEQLKNLDRWVATQSWLVLRRRAQLLAPYASAVPLPRPWGYSREDLIGVTSVSAATGDPLDLRLPSALRMATVVREAVRTHGSSVVGQGLGLYGQRGVD